MTIKYYKNGYIVRPRESIYQEYIGVDGSWMPIRGKYKLDFDVLDDDYVHAYTDLDLAKKYARYLKLDYKKVDILYCNTTKPYPITNIEDIDLFSDFTFIGYDYAYSGGSFFSCIFNDVNRIKELNQYKLNQYSLIQTESELLKFIKERTALAKNDSIRFEGGDFIIYKLWRYTREL